ncbi:MAG TPA: hypothetical protein VGX25_19985 [Actinophytocola sp.]|uniref:hypothetical protein n=1 Tax=Actinophytocola sp. TaxID=1872138 RepID=UPI002DDD5E36|nr:hypothetical protein [Actinophytocola sp.]HEV2781671.1 hypothetical protein [Actinophytocola sp.]
MTASSGSRPWEADPRATFARRLGKHPTELDEPTTDGKDGCPDIWELSNGDVAVIGRDLTEVYAGRLPEGVTVVHDERLVVIPRVTIVAAKQDIPDA